MNGTATRSAEKQQLADIRKLLADLRELGEAAAFDADVLAGILNEARDQARAGDETKWNFDVASRATTSLMNFRDKHRAAVAEAAQTVAASTPVIPRPQVDAGRYAIRDEQDADVVHFYVVEISDRGYFTVFAQASSDLHELAWGPARAALKKIETDPKGASILYGKEKGVCGRCGAELTSKWRLAGIGPVCSTKF